MLPGLKKIDTEQSPGENQLIGAVCDVYQALTKTNILIKESLWRKSPTQLVQSGNVFFMYTCLDFTLTTGYFLRKAGICGHFIINELQGNGGPKIHFGIETPYGFIDHVIGNSVIIGDGELPNFYGPMKGEIQTKRHRIELKEIDDCDTIFDIVRKTGLKVDLLSEQTARALGNQFQKDNTPEVWKAFVDKAGGNVKKPTLFLKSQ